MAATLFRAPIVPLPTPVSTAFVHQGSVPRIGRRFENGTLTTTSRGPNCSNFSGFQTCSSAGDYGSCLASSTEAAVCNCGSGIQYLDCVSEALASSTCLRGVGIDGNVARQHEKHHQRPRQLTLTRRRLGRLRTIMVPVVVPDAPSKRHDSAAAAVGRPRHIP